MTPSPPNRTYPPVALPVVIGVLAVLTALVATVVVYRAIDDDTLQPGDETGTNTAEGSGEVVGPAVLDGHARSVVVSGTVRNLRGVHLRGGSGFLTVGSVTDAEGNALGPGTLESRASDVRVIGSGLRFGVHAVRIAPSGAGFISAELLPDTRPSGVSGVSANGPLTVEASSMTFLPDPADGATQPPAALTLRGPVSLVSDEPFPIQGSEWVDVPPGAITVDPKWLTWAGSGGLAFDGESYAHEFVGVRGDDGTVTIERGAPELAITGGVTPRQIWLDGIAQLTTSSDVEVKRTPNPAVPGEYATFTWAPTNRGAFDMAMTSITPANAAGAWVELALDPLPDMDGGEDRPARGGTTTGLIYDEGGFFDNATQPISSVIRPGTGDEREIGIHVPDDATPGDYTVALVVEGNFEPIRVEVPVRVIAR